MKEIRSPIIYTNIQKNYTGKGNGRERGKRRKGERIFLLAPPR